MRLLINDGEIESVPIIPPMATMPGYTMPPSPPLGIVKLGLGWSWVGLGWGGSWRGGVGFGGFRRDGSLGGSRKLELG